MPEGLEAEIWRVALAPTIGRVISSAWVDDRIAPDGFVSRVVGSTIVGLRRAGKVVLIDTDESTIGLHFGMTGRVVVDGEATIERLEYASGQDRPDWDRLRLFTGDQRTSPAVRLNDPRRLARISLDPDLSHLGVDLFTLSVPALVRGLDGRRVAIKTALLNQRVVAGLGNLCADEILWWSGVAPQRSAGSLDPDEMELLVAAANRQLPIMLRLGGSTMGILSPEVRSACPPCERDGHPLRRDSIVGRTSVWCPEHQH